MDDQELDEIRRRVDIVDLVSHYVTLKKAGANFRALCPFHQERTPSFMVSPEKQIFKCFGCGKGGDIFTFIMEQEGLTFPEAARLLADRAGVKLKPTRQDIALPKENKNELYAINELALKYFQTILWQHPTGKPALKYLRERGLKDDIIKKFHLGYAPAQKGLQSVLTKRGFSPEMIVKAGRPDIFYSRIMFPIHDPLGNVIALTGRVFPGSREPKYLNTAETPLFHKGRVIYGLHLAKQAIKQSRAVVLVEGQMDVIASHQAGVVNTVASSGTAITLDHFRTLYRFAPKFILAFDNDEAGLITTEKIAQIALVEGYSVYIAVLPDGVKDPADLATQDPQKWQEVVNQALPAVDWYFKRAFASYDQLTADKIPAEAKKNIAKTLLPIINNLPDVIEQAHYVQQLAKRLNVKEEVLTMAMSRTKTSSDDHTLSSSTQAGRGSSPDLAETILAFFIQYPSIAFDYYHSLKPKQFPLPFHEHLAEVIKIWYHKYDKPPSDSRNTALINFLRQQISDNERPSLDKILSIQPSLDAIEVVASPDEQKKLIKDELSQSMAHLELLSRDKHKEDFAAQIATAEAQGDRERVKQLLNDLQTFLQKKEKIHDQKGPQKN